MTPDCENHVRNLLGIPPNDSIMDDWTPQQVRDHLLLETRSDVADIRKHGCDMHTLTCERIDRLSKWRSWMLGAMAGVITVVTILYYAGVFERAGMTKP